ncbi:ATP-binding cassette sub-family G member 8 [Schistocerca cancellata]|uniref:ATP-binding cassette sub-family G member 8 n=1 Tax=Schistocerca cancellata TaxID=274614 RepID=UPI0021199DA8|nr:ATP-binding cassette sub-family G member 8 [Schistocerca cancellata]
MERRYSVPPAAGPSSGAVDEAALRPAATLAPSASEDLHAWSIYRQNLNSDFTDSALGSSEKSPLPYGNFQLRESTVQSILNHPRYGPKSALGANMYTYLKFGLPRVFPPSRGPRDGSSGYDSSDDGSPNPHHHGRYMRSRSDPDFRNHFMHKSYTGHGPWPGLPPGAGRAEDFRLRSTSSEANLMSHEAHIRHHTHRRSMHEHSMPFDIERSPVTGGSQLGVHQRPSKAGSHISLPVSRHSHSHPPHPHMHPAHRDGRTMSSRLGPVSESAYIPRESYCVPLPENIELGAYSKYPHLQVRGLEVETGQKQQLLLAGISFEVHGGEIMAVMATTEEEGTALLEVLSGRSSNIGKIRGDVILNGQPVHSKQLKECVAYVHCDGFLCPDLSVLQTLHFYNWMRKASSLITKMAIKDRIDALIEDLGLDQVRYTKVASLTMSEKCRLSVASQLLLDTDIVVLDQPTRGMDIFDTFFLIEFLRQWAGNGGAGGISGGRIVILTLHPPTYEIFTMLSRVVLISAGQLMFSGRRRDMLPYFATVDYPCPAYKNPSDYYLDLVTLDDLSAEAMLESSQRIEQLAELFRRRQEPLSDPGPPVALPASVKQANCCTQIFMLLLRALIYTQPLSLIQWCTQLLVAAVMSVILGAIFFDLPNTDPQLVLGDRQGFHYAVACVAIWPVLLQLSLGNVRRERWSVYRDIRDHLYSRLIYIVTKFIYNIPASACVWLAYLIPAYLLSGLQDQTYETPTLYIYLGYMLLQLLALQTMATVVALAVRVWSVSSLLVGLVGLVLSLASGLLLHPADMGEWCRWIAAVSPAHLLLPPLLHRQYQPQVLAAATATCHNRPVQRQDIIVQVACPPPNGTAALLYSGLIPGKPEYALPLTVLVFWVVCFLLAAASFLICRHQPRRPRTNPNKP